MVQQRCRRGKAPSRLCLLALLLSLLRDAAAVTVLFAPNADAIAVFLPPWLCAFQPRAEVSSAAAAPSPASAATCRPAAAAEIAAAERMLLLRRHSIYLSSSPIEIPIHRHHRLSTALSFSHCLYNLFLFSCSITVRCLSVTLCRHCRLLACHKSSSSPASATLPQAVPISRCGVVFRRRIRAVAQLKGLVEPSMLVSFSLSVSPSFGMKVVVEKTLCITYERGMMIFIDCC